MNKLILGVGAVALCGVVPQVAVGHDATVACVDGKYVVTPDFLERNPETAFGDGFAIVRWNDGFTRRLTLPAGCVTPPVPVAPEIIPAPVVPPPAPVIRSCADLLAQYPKAGPKRLVGWGCPERPKVIKPPRAISIRYYPCPSVGKRAWTITTVTTASGKTGTVKKWGKRCKMPRVTG